MAVGPLGLEEEEPVEAPLISPFVPLLLLFLVVAGWFTFTTTQLVRERDNLRALRAGQEKGVEESTKVRSSLDSVLHDTAVLATKGNGGARLIIEGLGRRGLTVNPSGPSIRTTPN